MHIELGATVHTADGHVAGKVSEVVVDREDDALDAFILHTGWLGQDLIVPMKNILQVDDDGAIHLRISEQQVRELDAFLDVKFASEAIEDETRLDLEAGGGMLPMAGAGFGTPMTPMGTQFDPGSTAFMGMPNTNYDTFTSDNSLAEGESPLDKGTHVFTSDGHDIGAVHEIDVGEDGRVHGLIVTTGHFRTHQHYIPESQVKDAYPDEISLRITAAEFAEMEQRAQAETDQP